MVNISGHTGIVLAAASLIASDVGAAGTGSDSSSLHLRSSNNREAVDSSSSTSLHPPRSELEEGEELVAKRPLPIDGCPVHDCLRPCFDYDELNGQDPRCKAGEECVSKETFFEFNGKQCPGCPVFDKCVGPPLPECLSGEKAIRVPDVEPIGNYTDEEFNAALAALGVRGVTISTPPGSQSGLFVRDEQCRFGQCLISADDAPVGTYQLAMQFAQDLYRADFAEEVDQVWVDMGDFNGDEDLLGLIAYDKNDQIVDIDTFLNPFNSFNFQRLMVAGPSISYVKFSGLGTDGNSVFYDKLTFCPQVDCPGGCGK